MPLSYWRDNKSGPTASTFNTVNTRSRSPPNNPVDVSPQNVQIPHQYSTGSTRTGMMKTWRFRPYGTPSARSSERANTKAGSSTLAPPLIQYVAPLATYRSGGSSKTTAYAETKPTITEENAPPVSNFYRPHIPHVTDALFGVRRPGGPRTQENAAWGVPNTSKMSTGYASGRRVGRASKSFRATRMP